jgi:hypothetical protein
VIGYLVKGRRWLKTWCAGWEHGRWWGWRGRDLHALEYRMSVRVGWDSDMERTHLAGRWLYACDVMRLWSTLCCCGSGPMYLAKKRRVAEPSVVYTSAGLGQQYNVRQQRCVGQQACTGFSAAGATRDLCHAQRTQK